MAMTLRLDDEESQQLRALAEAEGISQQEAVRRAIRERYERTVHQAAVHEAGEWAVSRYASLLDRLSK